MSHVTGGSHPRQDAVVPLGLRHLFGSEALSVAAKFHDEPSRGGIPGQRASELVFLQRKDVGMFDQSIATGRIDLHFPGRRVVVPFGADASGNVVMVQLANSSGKVPTPHGPIFVDWELDSTFTLSLTIPDGVTAKVHLPATEGASEVLVGRNSVEATKEGDHWILTDEVSGTVTIEVR